MLFLTLTQLIFLTLIIWATWNALFKPAGPQVKKDGGEKKDGDAKPGDKPAGGGGGVPGTVAGRRPRDYLSWLGALIILMFIILAFITPNNPAVIQIWSVISFPLKPLGLAILLLSFAVAEIRHGGITRDAMRQVRAALIILVVFSVPLIAYFLVQIVEADSISALYAAPNRSEKVDAIVLLAQSTTQLTFLEPNQIHLTDAGDRVIQAVREYRQQLKLGTDPCIIVTAGPRPGITSNPNKINVSEAYDVAKLLRTLGIPQEAILIEPTGVDIHASAEAIKREYVDTGIINKRVILVSSALNMQRARQTFTQLGIQTIPSPASFYTFQSGAIPRVILTTSQRGVCDTFSITFRNTRDLLFSDFIPSVESLLLSTRVINEFWSSTYYFMRGWASSSVEPYPKAKDIKC